GIDVAAPSVDASGALDASIDSPATGDDDASDADVVVIDGGPCFGVVCNGACLVDASSCTSCDGGPLLCASTHACGAACGACPDRPIQCFDCDSNRKNPVGTCEPDDASA